MKMTYKQARYAARMTKKQVAEYLELSSRTVARYERTNCAPKVIIECLLLLAGKMPRIGRRHCFEDWSFGNGYLWSPSGEKFTSGEILALHINQQLVDELYRENLLLRKQLKRCHKKRSG
ncbi:hypothetical protein SAMN04488079_11091 [Methylophaga sulfidovorans]|uniref:Helix-turn-helix n=2 Tax=Methylophaga sulfidovorans TaxID=45496 RepID=A0A1I3ZEC9_9GAMM|nr:hypothetical protein SAMN04488079_11091 [Methylophaga sulfidovorans]